MGTKERLAKIMVWTATAVLIVLFFLPWISVGAEAGGVASVTLYSGFNFAMGTEILYSGAYPIVLILLALPIIILILNFTKISYRILFALATFGLLAMTAFVIRFAHGID